MEKFFKFKAHGTSLKREIVAGIIIFVSISYILIVNPNVLSRTGMDSGAVFTATALVAALGSFLMGMLAKLPIALAPSLGANTFFATTVVLGMGYSWQFALTAVFLSGVIMILLTLFNVREKMLNSIPENIKKAIGVGIGLFIMFIGLNSAGIVISGGATPVALGDLSTPSVWIALLGLIVVAVLMQLKVNGAIIVGIVLSTVLAIVCGVTSLPQEGWVSMPPSIAPIFAQFEWSEILKVDMLMVVFIFLFIGIFDTMGTLIGIAGKMGIITDDGKIPNVKKAMLADSITITAGSVIGSSPITTFVESSAGVAYGAKTGLPAIVVAVLMLVALFFAPIISIVPMCAIAPALIIVGFLMISSITQIKFDDVLEGFPAFLTIVMMPFTYSIADGIMFGIISYVLIKYLTGKWRSVSLTVLLIAIIMILKLIMAILS